MSTNDKEERNWGMFCHLAALACWIGIPFGNIIGPLIIWLVKKDELPLVDTEGKESLNFQISITIYALGALVLCFILVGIPLLIAIAIAQVALVIVAAIKISNGESYKYPFTIRFLN
ncbi:MAG: DUF4870 domain-containing protein [bacterium]